MTLPRFPGHLDCGERFASERGVQDGHAIPSRVPGAGGGVGTRWNGRDVGSRQVRGNVAKGAEEREGAKVL